MGSQPNPSDNLASLPSPTDDPAGALAASVTFRRLAERLEAEAVQAAIAQGWTWASIAQALGVTRQAAHKKHARAVRSRRQGEPS